MDRIDQVYQSLDEMATEIKRGAPDDPNRTGKVCVWPDTFLAWRAAVQWREQERERSPLTPLQWTTIEYYMVGQHGFQPINEDECEVEEAEGVGC